MVITAIAISLMMGFWGDVNRQIFSKQRESIAHSQLNSISTKIYNNLRKSPGILQHHATGITFIHNVTKDTLQYEFLENRLTLNNKESLDPISPFFISNFEISPINKSAKKQRELLQIQIIIEDGNENKYSANLMVSVNTFESEVNEKENLDKWNF